jgi:hypothetical protein
MTRIFARPDLLIDSLPDRIRKAYQAAEGVLVDADCVVCAITGSDATNLPQSAGRLWSLAPGVHAAVRDVEAELLAARGATPFTAMGRTHTTAHVAALEYGRAVAIAVLAAAERGNYTPENPGHFAIVDARGEEGAIPWANHFRQYLSDCGILTTEGESSRPGPEWEGFCKKIKSVLQILNILDLRAHMRAEVVAWNTHRQAKGTGERPPGEASAREKPPSASGGRSGQADREADKPPIKRHMIPDNPEVMQLARLIRQDRRERTKTDVALEFTDGDEARAQSLLRQLRRYPDLLS